MSVDVCVLLASTGFGFCLGLHSSAKEGGGRLLMARPRQAVHAGPAECRGRAWEEDVQSVGGCAVDWQKKEVVLEKKKNREERRRSCCCSRREIKKRKRNKKEKERRKERKKNRLIKFWFSLDLFQS